MSIQFMHGFEVLFLEGLSSLFTWEIRLEFVLFTLPDKKVEPVNKKGRDSDYHGLLLTVSY